MVPAFETIYRIHAMRFTCRECRYSRHAFVATVSARMEEWIKSVACAQTADPRLEASVNTHPLVAAQ